MTRRERRKNAWSVAIIAKNHFDRALLFHFFMRIDDSCFRRILHLRYPTPDDDRRAATATGTALRKGRPQRWAEDRTDFRPICAWQTSPCSGPTILRSSVQRGGTSASGRCERVPNKHKNELLELLKQLLHSVERVNGTTVTVRPLDANAVVSLLFTSRHSPHLVVNARRHNVHRNVAFLQQLLSGHLIHALRALALQPQCPLRVSCRHQRICLRGST